MLPPTKTTHARVVVRCLTRTSNIAHGADVANKGPASVVVVAKKMDRHKKET